MPNKFKNKNKDSDSSSDEESYGSDNESNNRNKRINKNKNNKRNQINKNKKDNIEQEKKNQQHIKQQQLEQKLKINKINKLVEKINNGNELNSDDELREIENNVNLTFDEKLFWKIWKNKHLKFYIFNIVNSNKHTINSFKYDQIKSVQWLLRNKYYDLLKLKVKRSEHLVDFFDFLNETTSYQYRGLGEFLINVVEETRDKLSIFKEIQNDSEFYENLFKNYPQYFLKLSYADLPAGFSLNQNFACSISPQSTVPYSLLEYSIKLVLKYDNLSALVVLVKKYNANIKMEDFYDCISFGSLKCSKFLINYLKYTKNDIVAKVWKVGFINKVITESSPIISQDFDKINYLVKFLLLDIKLLPPKELNKVKEDIFKFNIFNLSIKQLIESCETISLLLENTNFFSDYLKSLKKKEIRDKYQNFTGILQDYLPDPQIDFISYQQLKEFKNQLIQDFHQSFEKELVYKISSDNQIVKKCFKYLITFTCYEHYYKDNLIYYHCKYLKDFSMVNLSDKFNSLCFGSIDNLKLDELLIKSLMIIIPNENKEIVLFKYCQNDLNQQYQFIDKVINKLIENINNIYNEEENKLDSIQIMEMLLSFNRLELIKLFYEKLVEIDYQEDEIFPKEDLISKFCNSLEVFDYLLNLNSNSINIQITLENCLKNQLKLMNHIKLNHKQLYRNLFLNQEDYDQSNVLNYSKESLLFIYNNIGDFDMIYKQIEIWTRWDHFRDLELNEFIQIVNGTPIYQKYNYQCFSVHDTKGYKKSCQFLDWIYNNRQHDLVSGRCDRDYGKSEHRSIVSKYDTNMVTLLYHYYCNRFDMVLEYFKQFNGKSNITPIEMVSRTFNRDPLFAKLRYLIASRGDVENLDKLFKFINYYPNDAKSMVFIQDFYLYLIIPILAVAQISGQIVVFEFFKNNYPWILDINVLSRLDHYYTTLSNSTIVFLSNSLLNCAIINNNFDFLKLVKSYVITKSN